MKVNWEHCLISHSQCYQENRTPQSGSSTDWPCDRGKCFFPRLMWMKDGCAGSPHNKTTGYEDSICQASDCSGHVFPSSIEPHRRSVLCVKGWDYWQHAQDLAHSCAHGWALLQGRDTEQVSKGNTHDWRRNVGELDTLLQDSSRGIRQETTPSKEQWQPMWDATSMRLSKDSTPMGVIGGRGHKGTLWLSHTSIADFQKESRSPVKTVLFAQFRHNEPPWTTRVMGPYRNPSSTTCKQAFLGRGVPGLLCELFSV